MNRPQKSAFGGQENTTTTDADSFAAQIMAKISYIQSQSLGVRGHDIVAPNSETELRPHKPGLGAVMEQAAQALKVRSEEERESKYVSQIVNSLLRTPSPCPHLTHHPSLHLSICPNTSTVALTHPSLRTKSSANAKLHPPVLVFDVWHDLCKYVRAQRAAKDVIRKVKKKHGVEVGVGVVEWVRDLVRMEEGGRGVGKVFQECFLASPMKWGISHFWSLVLKDLQQIHVICLFCSSRLTPPLFKSDDPPRIPYASSPQHSSPCP